VEGFSLKKLNIVEVQEQSQLKISKRFATLENLDSRDVSRTPENIRENIKISAKESLGQYEWKQHKLLFHEECLKFVDYKKQAKLQWLQGPSQVNADNLNNVRHETNRHFRNKKRDYLKGTVKELEKSKNRDVRNLYRGKN
jgi:hypothetical protein